MSRSPNQPPEEYLYRQTTLCGEGSRQNGPSTSQRASQILREQLLQRQLCQASDHAISQRSQSAPTPKNTKSSEKFDYRLAIPVDRGKEPRPLSTTTPCKYEAPCERKCFSMEPNSSSLCWEDSSQVGINYGAWQRGQQMHQQQQRSCRQPNTTCYGDDDTLTFSPNLNSTMIDQQERNNTSGRNYQQPKAKTCCLGKNASRMRQTQERTRSQTECAPPEWIGRQEQCQTPEVPRGCMQYESMEVPRRRSQYEASINQTSYMQPPESLGKARCKSQENQSRNSIRYTQNELSFPSTTTRSQPPLNFSGNRNQGSTFGEKETRSCREGPSLPKHHETYMETSQALSGKSCLTQSGMNKSIQSASRSTRISAKSPEDRLAERTQTEFMDSLVRDRYCPGIIQESLNNNENFNEYAFEIAFAGSVPSKPFPVDPMSMLEAIKLRIDDERSEIRKMKIRDWERDKEGRSKSKDGKSNHPGPVTMADIDSYFEHQHQSEVNDGLTAFLKAENEYRLTSTGMDAAFDADVNSFDTNFFDERIKLNAYTATTKPGYN